MRAFYFLGNTWEDYTNAFGYSENSERSMARFFNGAISFTVRVLVVSEKDFRFHIEGNPEQCKKYMDSFFEFYEGLDK